MTEDISPILSKVKKLLALSTSSNPNEAAGAAAKAQALLMQYNLDMSQVNVYDQGPAYEKAVMDIGNRYWRRTLLCMIARSIFCEVVYNPRSKEAHVIGQRHNQEVVQELYHYLTKQLETMAMVAYRQSNSSLHVKSWLDSFYMGALQSIEGRLEEQKSEIVAASTACRSLVVVKDAELEEAVSQFFPSVRKGAAKRFTRNAEGYNQGREAGNRVALNKMLPA